MVKGTVNYYGIKTKERYDRKAKSWKPTEERELVLTLKNPQFTEDAIKKVVEFYADSENLPKWYDALVKDGKAPEYITFKTRPEYAPKNVCVIEDGKKFTKSIDEVDMLDAEIIMTYRGCYLGAIMVTKNGRKFDAFDSVDFENLPFK